MESFERARLDAYFAKIAARFAPDDLATSFLVTHLLPERPAFVRAVGAMSQLRAVLPKPKSVNHSARREVERSFACDVLSREVFAGADSALEYFESRAAGETVALLDVGGYFAPTIPNLQERFSGRLVGVIEDTENGHRRYEDLAKLPCPVVSVARSPLKDPEDFLVGQSVVFSTEAVMRGRGDILHGRPALVIGFGKLGSSIARLLQSKGVHVTVFDIDPVRRTQALSQGFAVARDRESALNGAGLVLCATGAISLRGEDFPHLRNGAYVATVTSSEDELELLGLPDVYTRATVSEHVTRYRTTGHYFYLANGGNAVNFLHGASVGPFIFLVQAEILAAIRMLTRGDLESGMHEVSATDRAAIAAIWLNYFNR
ncbi:NAD-binding protein [Streptomyces fildesensis]|uniref:NAD-binding protein n=1 Tax=Streptomyces fildesensis TaxID=375757 RepID=A0ABW8BZR2_9ACTN